MKIFHGIKAVQGKFPHPVVAIGVFDGLHLGHQMLIRKAVERAKFLCGTSIVMTFDPHPVHVLRPENHLPLLVSFPFRLQLIASLGVDVAVIVRFTKAFSRLAPEQFVSRYLAKPFSPDEVIVGDDFRFGQNRAGTIAVFEEAGQKDNFKVLSLKTKERGRKKFSSTLARYFFAVGVFKKAAGILGRPVSIMGRVIRGDQRGKVLGFPTVNIIPQGEILPPQGVYVVCVRYGGKVLKGMANIGVRPSFYIGERLNVEAHLFDFNKNIYGQEIIIEFLQKVRDELYFPSSDALISQLKNDEMFSRVWFSRHKF